MSARKIAVLTATRAEYGLLEPVIVEIAKRKDLKLQLVVTGAHLDARFGMTVKEIEKDGHPIAARVPLPLSDDSGPGIAKAMGAATAKLAEAFASLKPDVLVVLGDRYEILAAASAALPLRLPVAHIHGGESSEGAWDESARHAVTKLSHLHFAAHPEYAERIKKMGEDPKRVFCFGSPFVDRLRAQKPMKREELEKTLGIQLEAPVGVLTYHPATLSEDRGLAECQALLRALMKAPGTWILTYPNADAGAAAVLSEIKMFAAKYPRRASAFSSLGRLRYLSVLAHADVMAGNSSSGLLEAPYFRLPVVNVGTRQDGRLREKNVIDVPKATAVEIGKALARALTPKFRKGLRAPAFAAQSPSKRIVDTLAKAELGEALLKKKLHDR